MSCLVYPYKYTAMNLCFSTVFKLLTVLELASALTTIKMRIRMINSTVSSMMFAKFNWATSFSKRQFCSNSRILHPETGSLHLGYDPKSTKIKSIKPPLYLSSTFVFENSATGADAFGQVYGLDGKHTSLKTPFIYSRVTNPNLLTFEQRLAAWDKMNHCLLFSSGMAAISTLFHTLLKPGINILFHEFISFAKILTNKHNNMISCS